MFKETLLILSLFSLCTSSTFAPFHQRHFEYSISDLCSYDYSNFQYVKPCQTNYQCKNVNGGDSHSIHTCKEYFKTIKRFGDDCISDIECDSGLKCSTSTSKCVSNSDAAVYGIKDRVSSDYYYYCNANFKATKALGSASCESTTTSSNVNGIGSGLCYQSGADHANIKTVVPDFGYVCGQNTWTLYSTSNPNYPNHYLSQTQMNRIGTLEDGTFVDDKRACKSGFALKLYFDKTLKEPTSGDTTKYSVCVTLKGIEVGKNNYVIYKYSLNNNEYSYNTKSTSIDSHLMTKLDLFKEYVNKAKDITCQAGSGHDDEQFTCGNDDLRRAWYFYNNPSKYLLYKNEDAIIDYLLQLSYPDYKPRYTEPQQEASGYLSIKFISLLILLLSL